MKNNIDFSLWNASNDNFNLYKNIKSNLIYGKYDEKIPFISVIIPTYQRPDLLKQAINSVLNQVDFNDYEIIVVDNDSNSHSSTDQLMKQICLLYKNVYYYRNESNLGMYGNWNRCIEICRSEWFCMLHDDDLLKSNYLISVTDVIKKNQDIAILSVYRENLDQRKNKKNIYFKYGKNRITSLFIFILIKFRKNKLLKISLKDCINFFNPLLLCAVFHKQRCIEAGGFDEQYAPISDYYFICKIVSREKVVLLPKCLWYYRYAENGTLNIQVQKDALYLTRYLVEELCKFISYNKKKIKSKYSEAVLYMWSGNSKLTKDINFQDAVINNCKIDVIYSFKIIQLYVFLKRHILRIFLFLKK